MTAIEAPGGRVENQAASGIRPFDITRDLLPVANLIADAFAAELDSRGMAALREMRLMGHMGAFLKLFYHAPGDVRNLLHGYVWVEDGRIIGNVTLQRADRHGSRWQIANVAVMPEYRGRGIARRLMERTLEHITDVGARWAVLQVYEANGPACHLYDAMGFETLGGMTELRLARVPRLAQGEPPPTPPVLSDFRPFSARHEAELYDLANRQLSNQAQWWRPVQRQEFQIPVEERMGEWFWRTLGRRNVLRRAVYNGRRFDAALELKAQRRSGAHELKLWVRPELYGLYEGPLFDWVLATLYDYPRLPVTLSLPTDHEAGLAAAQARGFVIESTLLTMRKQMGRQIL
ncbi:MAG: GNAT family N-acetyltransferase [Caldilineaceae bacterium]|nr:GNAT family N-acetyltransferase [Caldilineaceae bacterium]